MSESNPIAYLKNFASALRSLDSVGPSTPHLDDDSIAALVSGDAHANQVALAHAADCADCRARVANVRAILDDTELQSEMHALDGEHSVLPRRWTGYRIGFAGSLAAAAVATIVLLGPRMRSESESTTHREPAITTAAAPTIISPTSIAKPGESLRWTSVKQADLYRIRVWDKNGNVVLGADTRDTVIAFPSRLVKTGNSYFMVVKARTGWDRWVSSDFVEFKVSNSPDG